MLNIIGLIATLNFIMRKKKITDVMKYKMSLFDLAFYGLSNTLFL